MRLYMERGDEVMVAAIKEKASEETIALHAATCAASRGRPGRQNVKTPNPSRRVKLLARNLLRKVCHHRESNVDISPSSRFNRPRPQVLH